MKALKIRSITVFILINFLNIAFLFSQASQRIVENRKNSTEQMAKPYVILISADGFRHDYAEKFDAKNIKRFADQGVRAESLIPSFPSVTFPNHYSIVTGLYPSHHGLVHNSFYDPNREDYYGMSNKKKVKDGTWYGGTPLWVLAEAQRMVTASYFWVGSEADIKGTLPTYHYPYNEKTPIESRIQTVVDWLKLPEESRPHLITFYFPEVDHEGHEYGPNATQTAEAVHFVDSSLYRLTEAVKTTGLPVNFIFVSDHGMTTVDTVNMLKMPQAVDTSKFIIPSYRDIVVDLIAKDKKDIAPTFKRLKKAENGFKAYLKTDMPKHLHYSAKDDRFNRIGDIVLLAEAPKIFNFSTRKPNPGRHGYDPTKVKDVHGIFYAWGPGISRGTNIPSFPNVEIYPLIAHILGLTINEQIDGTGLLLKKDILVKQ